MGATPKSNPYGDCPICLWPAGETPYNVSVRFIGVKRPNNHADWPLMNSTYTLHAVSKCIWESRTFNHYIQFRMYVLTLCYATIWIEEAHTKVQYFWHDVPLQCKNDFVNAPADPDWSYHDGTAEICKGLPHPPPEFVPAYGLLPYRDRWKYELARANGNRQLYLGSHKYKTNCHVLYDPQLIDV